MKFSTLVLAVTSAMSASAWKIHWQYQNGQYLYSHGSGTSSGCINLRVNNVPLNYYNVDFATDWVRDPNRVRIWSGTNCGGTLLWDSNKSGKNDLVPNRNVVSYKIDHD